MKTKMIIAFLIVIMIGCKKQDNTTRSSGGGSSTQSTSVSATEAYLEAHWVFDSSVWFQSNVPTIVTKASAANINDYVYDVYSTPYSGGSSNLKNISYGRVGQAQTAASWYVNNIYLSATGLLYLECMAPSFSGYIITSCNNKLVVSLNYGSVKQGNYYYLHK
jgi:hypothetical protein